MWINEENKIFISLIHKKNIKKYHAPYPLQQLGDYLFCFQFVTSTSSTFCYSHVMVFSIYQQNKHSLSTAAT